MFYNFNSVSFLLFYVCHLLVTVINGQHYGQQPQPVAPQAQPRQYYGYRRVTNLPTRETQYYHSYNLTDTGYTEHLYTKPSTFAHLTSQPINRQVRNNQGYSPDGGSDVAVEPELLRDYRYRSVTPVVVPQIPPQPQLLPQFSPLSPQFPSRLPPPMVRPFASPVVSPVVPPSISPNVPRYGPVMPKNQANYQHGERAQYQPEYSSNVPVKTVRNSGNEVSVPQSYNLHDAPSNSMIDYLNSEDFKKQLKDGKLTTVSLFQNTISGTYTNADETIIRANLEKIPEYEFNNGTSDCKPMPTVVKFGYINQPEIIYNPSSVIVPRCPQACFSWQFDCIPVRKTKHNFTAAVYIMDQGKVTREVNQFELVSHTECQCQCKTQASCLSHPPLSYKRPKSNF